MGKVAYFLRLVAGLMMTVSIVAACFSFSDAMDNLGRPGGERILGTVLLGTFAGFLIVFASAGVLWVLTDISEQIGRRCTPEADATKEGNREIELAS
jgi:hypothetical protein